MAKTAGHFADNSVQKKLNYVTLDEGLNPNIIVLTLFEFSYLTLGSLTL